MGWVWDGITYTKSNGYGTIDTHAEQFQVGKRLYDTQVLWTKIKDKGYQPTNEEILELCHWYCELVSWVGQLRSDYDVMVQCAKGKARYIDE